MSLRRSTRTSGKRGGRVGSDNEDTVTRLSSQVVAPTPIVSAEQVAAVTDAYLDRMADLARRLEVPVPAVGEVTRRAGVAMVDACVREPETVLDILGCWAANIRVLAGRARTGTPTGMPAAVASSVVGSPEEADTGDVAAVSTGREARRLATVLEGLDEHHRLALLMRDSYDAPAEAVAVALGVTAAESVVIVAEARLRLMEGINGRPAPTLAGHDVIAGISLGTLGALADGSADDSDPAVRLRRRHVGGCQACASILDSQNRARVVLAGLPVLSLPDATRATTLKAILGRASSGLPSAAEVEAAVARDTRVLPAAVVGVALALALLIGVGVGAILRHSKATAGQSPTPSSSGLILSTPSASATPKKTARATPSATDSTQAIPSFLQSYSPSAVPSSAKPSPSKSKAKKSATPRASRPTSVRPTTSVPVVTTAPPAGPPSQPPTMAAPTTGPPTPSAPPSPAPTSSSP